MRMSRRLGLYGGRLPTFESIFRYATSYMPLLFLDQAGRSGSSAGKISFTPSVDSNEDYNDGIYYSFFAAGGSFEVSRLDVQDGVFTKTLLACASASGATKYYTSITNNGHTITSDSVYSGNITTAAWLRRNFSSDVIDEMFMNAKYTILKSRLSSSLTNTDSNLRIPKADIGGKGVVIASYRDVPSAGTFTGGAQCSVFNVCVAAEVPRGIQGHWTNDNDESGTWIGADGLYEKTTSGVTYILPNTSANSDTYANARVRSYTLVQLEETW